MKYPTGEQLRQIERWCDTKLAPRMVEALQSPADQLLKKLTIVERGVKIARWLGRAKEAEKQLYLYDKYNDTIL